MGRRVGEPKRGRRGFMEFNNLNRYFFFGCPNLLGMPASETVPNKFGHPDTGGITELLFYLIQPRQLQLSFLYGGLLWED